MIRLNHNRDCLMFYELIEEAESKEELEATIENLIDSFREGISDFWQIKAGI